MTRKEEIEQQEKLIAETGIRVSFKEACEWADRTMLDKVCEWLMLNADDYIFEGVEEYSSAMRHDFIENFRKAMEE